jgi:hypothetical protein
VPPPYPPATRVELGSPGLTHTPTVGLDSPVCVGSPMVPALVHAPVVPAHVHAPMVSRPQTRLQQGIRKPKVHTDGTIRYANLVASGESASVQEALGHK